MEKWWNKKADDPRLGGARQAEKQRQLDAEAARLKKSGPDKRLTDPRHGEGAIEEVHDKSQDARSAEVERQREAPGLAKAYEKEIERLEAEKGRMTEELRRLEAEISQVEKRSSGASQDSGARYESRSGDQLNLDVQRLTQDLEAAESDRGIFGRMFNRATPKIERLRKDLAELMVRREASGAASAVGTDRSLIFVKQERIKRLQEDLSIVREKIEHNAKGMETQRSIMKE